MADNHYDVIIIGTGLRTRSWCPGSVVTSRGVVCLEELQGPGTPVRLAAAASA